MAMGIVSSPAAAHPSPSGCTSNSLGIELIKNRSLVRNGDVVNYTVLVENVGSGACDVTGVGVVLQLPARDGTPTGQTVTLATSETYPAGMAEREIGTVPWTVDVDPGVFDAVPQARVAGNRSLHDEDTDHDVNIDKTLGTRIIAPSATLTVTPNPNTGGSPLDTTFTYTFTNTSASPGTPLQPPSFNDEPNLCTDNATPTGGDTNGNHQVDNGESWTYTCSARVTDSGTTNTTVTASVNTALEGDQKRPVTVPPATASVVVTTGSTNSPSETPGSPESPGTPGTPGTPSNPSTPANPNQPSSGVLGRRLVSPKSRRARGDASCISTPRKLRIRARERTTVRVRVGEQGTPARRALVRIIGPGFVKRKVTNRRGVAVFRVRAKRAGRLVIQSDRCLGADRVSVLRARRVSNNQTPKGTG
jgi:hypothetical protein